MSAGPERPDRLDLAVVARQLGREGPDAVHPISRIVVRCPWQLPAIVEDMPYDSAGRPFPTLFYLTCPTAAAAVHRVESAGALTKLAARLDESSELQAALRSAERYESRARTSGSTAAATTPA